MPDFTELSLEDRQELEQICDEFESAWQSGQQPDLEDYADRLRESFAIAGLTELVILDAHYRRGLQVGGAGSTGDSAPPTWEDYVRRFPQLETVTVPLELGTVGVAKDLLDERFRGLRPHAAGGLGRVSIAEDLQFGRTVAVKEMHGRFAESEEHRRRFLREAQIAGQLEHPSIVPVYLIGRRETGEPYYVMRMIRGRSLLEAINHTKGSSKNVFLNVERRQLLRRLMDVCLAVEFAHSKGVIHRDIKPDNIMLGGYGETLLVDWGLAKRVDEEEPQELDVASPGPTAQTQVGTVLGTPAYMSPEQADGKVEQVGPPTDIFSLGATLYHLLTGKAPRRNEQAMVADFGDSPVPKPLQAICRKAMAARPEDRYPFAKAIADDLELALADEPVSVFRDPMATRLRRWIKRNRSVASAGVAAICLAVVGLVAISWMSRVHASQLADKNRRLDQLLTQEQELRQAAEQSEKRASDAMNYLVTALRSPDPNRSGREVKVADVLDQAVTQLDEDFGSDPLMLARMLQAVGQTYFGLGLVNEAKPLVERAASIAQRETGLDSPATLDAQYQLALVYHRLADERATPILQKVVQQRRAMHGPDHPDVLRAEQLQATFQFQAGDAQQAVRHLEALLPRVRKIHGEHAGETLSLMNDLANAYHAAGQVSAAIAASQSVYRKRQETAPHSLSTIRSGSNYASHLLRAARQQEAVTLFEELLAQAREFLGEDHFQTLILLNRLGDCYLAQHDVDRGLPLIEESRTRSERVYGPEHPRTLVAANSLAGVYLNAGKYAQAIAQYRQVYDVSIRQRGPAHPESLTVANNLSSAYRLNQQYGQAIELFTKTREAQREKLGDHHPHTIRTTLNLAATFQEADRAEESLELCREAYQQSREHLGPDHPFAQTAQSLEGIGYLQLGQFEPARRVLQAVLESRTRTMPDHWLRFHSMSLLGEALLGLKQFEQAKPLLVEAYNELEARKSRIPPRAQNRLEQARKRLDDLNKALKAPRPKSR